MKKNNREDWINHGYKMVSMDGFNNLSIQALSRSLGKNKSSFYYYYGDMAIYEEALFKHHLLATQQFAHAVSACANFNPDILNLMLELKDDFFFHKQLRIRRDQPAARACFEQAYDIFQSAVLEKWVDFLGLNHRKMLASSFLNLASENFLLRITYDTYSFQWLENYLSEYSDMMKRINDSSSADK